MRGMPAGGPGHRGLVAAAPLGPRRRRPPTAGHTRSAAPDIERIPTQCLQPNRIHHGPRRPPRRTPPSVTPASGDRPSGPVVVIGGGTGRAHRRPPAGRGRRPCGGGGGGHRGRRDQPHRRARRLALRHRRPPLLHQGASRWRSSGTRSSPTRTSCSGPRMSRIFYDGKFYDYPIKLGNALANLGVVEAFLCGLSFLWVRIRPPQGPDHPRGLHRLQLRVAALPALLQDLQREGVGGLRLGDLGRLGCPADQGNVPVERGVGADPGVAGRQAPRHVEAGDQPHRGVPVPEVRARA